MEIGNIEAELESIVTRYNLRRRSPSNRSPIRPSYQQASNMSSDDIASFLSKSPTSQSRDWARNPGTSSAIASAMKALQEKIKFLETDNERLNQLSGATEEKYLTDKEIYDHRFRNESLIAT
jgi:predicted P-loop ATPase